MEVPPYPSTARSQADAARCGHSGTDCAISGSSTVSAAGSTGMRASRAGAAAHWELMATAASAAARGPGKAVYASSYYNKELFCATSS